MGTVVHLHRKTSIHRVSLSAMNIISRKYPEDHPIIDLGWQIVRKEPNKPFSHAELQAALQLMEFNKL